MQYCSVNTRINNSTKATTLCKNFVKICSVASEYKKGVFIEFLLRHNLTIVAHLARCIPNRLEARNFDLRRVKFKVHYASWSETCWRPAR